MYLLVLALFLRSDHDDPASVMRMVEGAIRNSKEPVGIMARGAKVHAEPNLFSAKIGELQQYDWVVLLESVPGWFHVAQLGLGEAELSGYVADEELAKGIAAMEILEAHDPMTTDNYRIPLAMAALSQHSSPWREMRGHIYKDTIRLYHRTITLNPKCIIARGELATVAYLHGMDTQAIAEWDVIVSLIPQNPFARYCRGTVYEAVEQPEKAIADYRSALRLASKEWHYRNQVIQRLEAIDGKGVRSPSSPDINGNRSESTHCHQ